MKHIMFFATLHVPCLCFKTGRIQTTFSFPKCSWNSKCKKIVHVQEGNEHYPLGSFWNGQENWKITWKKWVLRSFSIQELTNEIPLFKTCNLMIDVEMLTTVSTFQSLIHCWRNKFLGHVGSQEKKSPPNWRAAAERNWLQRRPRTSRHSSHSRPGATGNGQRAGILNQNAGDS